MNTFIILTIIITGDDDINPGDVIRCIYTLSHVYFDSRLYNLVLLFSFLVDLVNDREMISDIDSDKAIQTIDGSKPPLRASSVSLFVQLFGLLLRIDNSIIGPAYGTHCAFWLNEWSQFTAKLVSSTLSFMSTGLSDGIRCLFDTNHRGLTFANLIKNADIGFVMKLRTLLHSFAYRKILPFLLYGSTLTREFPVPRQTTWILSAQRNKMLTRSQDDSSSQYSPPKDKVRVKLYKGRPENPPKNQLAFYVHGGGFVLGTPESHDVSSV